MRWKRTGSCTSKTETAANTSEMLDAEGRRKKNLEHAQWRVDFLRSLLASHRLLPCIMQRGTWEAKEEDYMARLDDAELQLAELTAGFSEP
jgi:hypothetical protein